MERGNEDISELYVFVYGTLKPGGRYHQRFCSVGLVEATPRLVKGRLYDFPRLGYPAVGTGTDWVRGYLLRFAGTKSFCDGVLDGLDALEGYVGEHQDNEYERLEVQVFSVDYQPLRFAWLYVMSEAQIQSFGGVYLPAGNWPLASS